MNDFHSDWEALEKVRVVLTGVGPFRQLSEYCLGCFLNKLEIRENYVIKFLLCWFCIQPPSLLKKKTLNVERLDLPSYHVGGDLI